MRKIIFPFFSIAIFLCLGSPAAQAASWQPIGPEGGTVPSLAFAPSDPRVVYAGTYGGVFRSSDGGESWVATSNGLGPFFAFSLAVDPRDSAEVYVGTGSGLYVTTSGGASWRLLPVGFKPSEVLVLVVKIDSAHPRILYAATSSGLFRSADGGAHWAERDAGLPTGFPFQITALELDPDHPGTLYAGIQDNNFDPLNPGLLVYKTVDGGGSWTALTGLRGFGVTALARQGSTGTLYAAMSSGLFATQDGGATWASLSGLFFQGLVASPSGTLYGDTVTGEVVRSVDGGKTWSPLVPSAPSVTLGGFNSLALDPRGDRLLVGSIFRGIYSLDAGAGWAQVNHGLRAAYVTALAVSPASRSLLFAATLGEGVLVSGNGGKSFSARNAGLPSSSPGEIDVYGLAASPRAPQRLVAGSVSGSLARTSDTGLHWASETGLCLAPDVLALDPPNTVLIASSLGFAGNSCPGPVPCTAKVSRDGGASFTCLDGPPAVTAFLVDPLQPAVVYAASGDDIWKSTDSGGHFTRIASSLGMIVTSLAASPAAHRTLYAGGSQGVLKSTDGGVSWSPVNTGLPVGVDALVVDPANASLIYALVYGGAYESRDGGASWSSLKDGFPNTLTTALALDSVRHVLYVGTQGGVWALTVP